ncbi:MAG: nuclear transport factor 2 family protein [Candidatus Nanopelagicales bacterium]
MAQRGRPRGSCLPRGRAKRRLTAVFSREDGPWQLVHLHASIGVTKQQVGWICASASSPNRWDGGPDDVESARAE